MPKYTLIIMILLEVVLGTLVAQPTFNEVYTEGYLTTNVLADGEDMVMAANFRSNTFQYGVRWLRIDSTGAIVDEDSIKLSENRDVYAGAWGCLQKKPNGNFILVGYTRTDSYLLEVTPQFDTVRSRRYNYPVNDSIERTLFAGAVICASGDIAVQGEHVFLPAGDSMYQKAVLVARFDSAFNLLWERYEAEPRTSNRFADWEQTGYYIIEMADSSLIVSGLRWSNYYSDSLDNLLYRYDKAGTLLWSKIMGNRQEEDASAKLLTYTDTTFFVAQSEGVGRYTSDGYDVGLKIVTVAEYALDGSVLWEKTYGKKGLRSTVLAIKYIDTSLILLEGELDSTDYISYTSTRGISLTGDSLWAGQQYIPNQSRLDLAILYDLAVTPSGALLMAGTAEYRPSGQFSKTVWAIRTDSEGCLQPNCHSISLPEPIEINYGLSLYPNPAADYFTIEIDKQLYVGAMTITVSDLSGKVILTQSMTEQAVYVSTKDFIDGVYLVQVKAEEAVLMTKKVIISKR